MTRSAFRILVQFQQAHLRMTYTQMIGTTDFIAGPWTLRSAKLWDLTSQ